MFPPDFKIHILELRKHLHKLNKIITEEVLKDYYLEILETYHNVSDLLLNPPERILSNTDGHRLVPHKLIYDIDDPMAVFEALHVLSLKESREEILSGAEFDESQNLKRVEFPWLKKGNKVNKSWDNTVMGLITIESQKLIVELNSQERAKLFKTKLKKLLPSGWNLKATLLQPINDQNLSGTRTHGKSSSLNFNQEQSHSAKEQEELMQIPEVREKMEEMMNAHWNNWVNDSIPALGGLKPCDAVKTKDGRELLDALLTKFERDAAESPMIGQTPETFKNLRQRLGMTWR